MEKKIMTIEIVCDWSRAEILIEKISWWILVCYGQKIYWFECSLIMLWCRRSITKKIMDAIKKYILFLREEYLVEWNNESKQCDSSFSHQILFL